MPFSPPVGGALLSPHWRTAVRGDTRHKSRGAGRAVKCRVLELRSAARKRKPAAADEGKNDELIESYGKRIEKLGRGFRQRHMPALSAEDLAQNGYIAMLGAAQRFDPSKGVPFGAFLQQRLKGSMRDTLRAEARQGKRDHLADPRPYDDDGQQPDLVASIPSRDALPDARATRLQVARILSLALDVLTERERRIIVLAYVERRTQREIGSSMGGLTPGRICQIKTVAIAKLREYFRLRGVINSGDFL